MLFESLKLFQSEGDRDLLRRGLRVVENMALSTNEVKAYLKENNVFEELGKLRSAKDEDLNK